MTRNISRKTFLKGAICTLPAWTLFGSIALAVPVSQGWSGPKIPDGVKLRGANHVGSFNQANDDIWAGLWRVWDWSNWIRPQLDDIAKVGNTVRFWGNTLVMADGSLSLARYLTRWQQALDYAKSLGLCMYPCGGDLGHWGEFTWAQSAQAYTELAQLWKNYPNVIGVDIVNEANLTTLTSNPNYHQREPVTELLPTLAEIVRTESGLPVTFSRSLSAPDMWLQDYFTDGLGDFLDFHVYYEAAPTASLGVYSQPWGAGKRMVVGEFGADMTKSSTDRAATYAAIQKMTVTDPNCVGALAWSAYDLDDTPDWQFGLYDPSRRLRTDIGTPFATFPIADGR
jgi:hypothetical protein